MISPLDDRYYEKVKELEIFSEKNYFKKRVFVELKWYNFLAEILGFKKEKIPKIGDKEFKKFKEIEKKTKHDVKAIEYFLRNYVKEKWAIHMLLTSDDINNISYALMLKEYQENVLINYKKLIKQLCKIKGGPMPAFTHGKKAVPSRFERLILFHAYRLSLYYKKAREFKFYGKVSGASGDYNSFKILKNDFIFWKKKLKKFVESFGIEYEEFSTQIMRGEHYSDFFFIIININNIMKDLAEDLWLLNFREYLKLKVKRVGSSTMPHKINPIELENAVGNIELSNALLNILCTKLPVSKLYRDISDSTIKRNTGVALAHSLLAMKGILKFLKNMEFNKLKAKEDMDELLLSEALQIKKRLEGDEKAYEKIKSIFDKREKEKINKLIKKKLKGEEYNGFSEELIKEMKENIEKNIKN